MHEKCQTITFVRDQLSHRSRYLIAKEETSCSSCQRKKYLYRNTFLICQVDSNNRQTYMSTINRIYLMDYL